MTNMVERAVQALWKEEATTRYEVASDADRQLLRAHAVLEAAFQVTDKDAKAFFKDDDATITWLIDDSMGIELHEAMQALSDAALKEES